MQRKIGKTEILAASFAHVFLALEEVPAQTCGCFSYCGYMHDKLEIHLNSKWGVLKRQELTQSISDREKTGQQVM